jgi:hypothetical protein
MLKKMKRVLSSIALITFLSGCSSLNHTREQSPQALVIGTLHGAHILQADYPLSALQEILKDYHPDLLLVEIRPEPFANGLYEDGPLEMGYSTQIAQDMGIAVAPIDWWQEKDLDEEAVELTPGDQQEAQKEFTALAPLLPKFDFASMHDSAAELAISDLKNIQLRYGLDEIWPTRQAWIEYRALQAIRQHKAQRVLIFIGNDHRPELQDYLGAHHIQIQDAAPWLKSVKKAKADQPAPDSVLLQWSLALPRILNQSRHEKRAARIKLLAKYKLWKAAIDQQGACCVNIT